jgi:hypothetical protein
MPFRRLCMLPRHPPRNPLALHVDLEPTAGRFRLRHRNSPVQLQESKAELGIRLRMKCRSIDKSQDAPGYVRQRSPVDTTVGLLRAARLKKQATMPLSEILFAFRGPFLNPCGGRAFSDRSPCRSMHARYPMQMLSNKLHVAVEQQVFALLSCDLRSDVCIVAFQRLRDNISQSTERTGRSCEKLSSQ